MQRLRGHVADEATLAPALVAVTVALVCAAALVDAAAGWQAARYPVLAGALVAGTLCLRRRATGREARIGWAALALALALGGSTATLQLALYPLAGAGVVMLGRRRFRRLSWWLLLDAVIASLTLAALVVAVRPHGAHAAGTTGGPALDVLLLALLMIAAVWQGLRPAPDVALVSGGIALFALGDALSSSHLGLLACILVLGSTAGLARHDEAAPETPERWLAIVAPTGLSLVAVAMLACNLLLHPLDGLAVALARFAFGFTFVRIFVSFVATQRRLTTSLRDAASDALTGLGNRRALIADAEAILLGPRPAPHVLAIYDLDGFKQYNDTLGHEAGDRLLSLLGARLRATVGERGTVYRLGGDEFCLLAPARGAEAGQLLRAAAAALTQAGPGVAIEPSFGAASIPDEADDLSSALRLADRRMYEHKAGRTPAAGMHRLGLAEAR